MVVVALVLLELVKSAVTKCEVEEAKIPLVKLMMLVVELTPTPKLVPGVYGNAKILDEVT